MPHVPSLPTARIGAVAIVALLTVCSRAEAQTLTDDQLIEQGVSAYETGQFEDALRYLYAYRQRNPMPATLGSDPAYRSELDTAIEATINLLKARSAEISRLREQVVELGGAITSGIIFRPPLSLPPPSGAETEEFDEDCISFRPDSLEVVPVRRRWVLRDGPQSIKVFGSENEASTALRIIQDHGWNRHCFVGRPRPSMEYFVTAVRSGRPLFPTEAIPDVGTEAKHR